MLDVFLLKRAICDAISPYDWETGFSLGRLLSVRVRPC